MDARLQRLKQQLAEGGVGPVYVITGDDALALEGAARLVEQAAAAAGGVDRDAFELGEQTLDAAIDAACTRPMWTPRRLVHVRAASGLDTEQANSLLAYVKAPAPFSTLLVVTPKVDGRSSLGKTLQKAGSLISLSPPKPAELPSWLAGVAAEEGFQLDPRAARALVDAVGADPMALKTTLDKVINFVGERRPLGLADVEAVVVKTREEVVWDFTDACGAKDLSRALATLHGMLERGESPIGAVALTARHFRNLWKVKTALSRGASPPDAANALGLHPFVVKKLSAQVSRFDDARLRHFFRLFFETDRALKSSKLDDRLLVERLVFELCRR